MNIRVCQTKYNDVINSLRTKEPTKVTPEPKSDDTQGFLFKLIKII